MAMRWIHDFSEGTDNALAAAISSAKQGRLTDIAHLRSLAWGTLQYARISVHPPPIGQFGVPEYGELVGAKYANETDKFVGTILAKTLCHLAPTTITSMTIGTQDSGPVIPLVEKLDPVPIPPRTEGPHAIVLVIGIVAAAAAAIHLISKGAAVLNNELMRMEETQRLIARQAVAVQTVKGHAEREDKLGKTIPWNDVELQLIDSVRQTQVEHEEKMDTKFPSPFDGAFNLDQLAKDAKEGFNSILPLVGLGVVFLVAK